MAGNAAVLAKPQTEEIQVHQGDVALCLLVNRRTRTLRVIDFRSGPSLLKREIVRRVALEEGLERIFTVVEREEAGVWMRLGFHKEGSIPGFYKRTDAQVLGRTFSSTTAGEVRAKRLPLRAVSPATEDLVERSYQTACRLVRARVGEPLPEVRLQEARPLDVHRVVTSALRGGRALTELEPFGRGGERRSFLATARGGFSVLLSAECQPCFDNALLEVVTEPRTEKEAWLTAAALRKVGQALDRAQLHSVFSLTPADSIDLSAAMLAGGFRRTGRLPGHLLLRGERRDALLWSRRPPEGRFEH